MTTPSNATADLSAAMSGEKAWHAFSMRLGGRIFYNIFSSLRLGQSDFELKHCRNIALRREPLRCFFIADQTG